MSPALATLEAAKLAPSPVEGLEARLTTLRDGVVDIPTAEAAVERAQVSGRSVTGQQDLDLLCIVTQERLFSVQFQFLIF